MHLKTRVLLAVGCVSLLAMSNPALSKPAPRGLAHQVRNIHHQRAIHPKKITRRVPAGQAKPQAAHEADPARLVSAPVAMPPKRPALGWPALVREARKYMGTNPTARSRLWCATFMNLVLARLGYAGTNSDAALSFTDYGHRISKPEVGAIAVLSRGRRGGHVGVVSGIDPHGNPIIISGNHGRRVGEGVYSRARVVAYVMPTQRRSAGEFRVAQRAKPIAAGTARSPAMRRIPSHPRFEPIIESPIAELLAKIEAEQNRPRANGSAARPPTPHRIAPRIPERAQQSSPPRHRLFGRIFGSKALASVASPRPTPRYQRLVQPRGRIASAYVGRAGRQPVQRRDASQF